MNLQLDKINIFGNAMEHSAACAR